MAWLFTCCKILSVLALLQTAAIANTNHQAPPPEFKKARIKLGNKIINVEVADTEDLRAHGLMFRQDLPADQGMLFIFDNEQPLNFWMKNTFLDLSIGFFDKTRTLVDIQEMKKTVSVMDQNPPSYASAKPSQFALEMNKGWFVKNKIKVGSRLQILEQPKSRSSGPSEPKITK